MGGVMGGIVTDTAPPPPSAPLRVGGDVKAPVVINRVEPSYPEVARKARISGIVIVECIIDRTGAVRDAKVVQSSSKLFEQSALDAVQRWQFSPGTLHGQPLDTIFDLTVKFEITQ